MKKIFDYIDYHEYLRDYYVERKQENAYFSFRFMGMKLGLDPGFVAKVLQGKMHLAIGSIASVAALCRLTRRETDYFDAMVKFGRAKNEKDVHLYYEQMMTLKGVETSRIEKRQYQFYTRWYHTAIRALLGYWNFAGDYEALARKLSPPITVDEARESVDLLEDLGFIERADDGSYRLADRMITTGDSWRSAAIRSFQEETLTLARESLERHSKELRDISTITVAVSHDDLEEIRARAKEFRQSILQMKTGNEKQDVVYQINIQVIPLTEIGSQ